MHCKVRCRIELMKSVTRLTGDKSLICFSKNLLASSIASVQLCGYDLDSTCRRMVSQLRDRVPSSARHRNEIFLLTAAASLGAARLPIWVIRVVLTVVRRLLVFPRKRISSEVIGMSQTCQKRTIRSSDNGLTNAATNSPVLNLNNLRPIGSALHVALAIQPRTKGHNELVLLLRCGHICAVVPGRQQRAGKRRD